ncbi:hypothetical protein D3C85_1880720 [compost metagenome]
MADHPAVDGEQGEGQRVDENPTDEIRDSRQRLHHFAVPVCFDLGKKDGEHNR